MSAQPEQARETRWVDPATLITRANVRQMATADPELVASVTAQGIIQPPVVYPGDGEELVLLAGHRRTAAAIEAGLARIEVLVTTPPAEVDRLATQVSENTNRAGLRAVEVGAAVEQMTLLGVPAGQIAKTAGLRKAQVEAARAVAAANESVKAAIVEAPELTLEQAAALTSWGTDPDAVADLLAAAEKGPVAFEHTQARLTSNREDAAKLADAANEWTGRGYTVFSHTTGYDRPPEGAKEVRDLVTGDGTKLGPSSGYYGVGEAHATCPGRGVVLSVWRPEDVTEVCTDAKGNGHKKAPSPYGGTPRAQEERSTVIAKNRLWKAATGVRQGHVARLVGTGKHSPGLVNALHLHLLNHPEDLNGITRSTFTTLTEHAGPALSVTEGTYGAIHRKVDPGAPPARVTGILLAAVASGAEKSLDFSTWRHPSASAADWLKLLVTHTGYQLADVELTAVQLVDKRWKAPTTPTSAGSRVTAAAAKATTGKAAGKAAGKTTGPRSVTGTPDTTAGKAAGKVAGKVAGKEPAPRSAQDGAGTPRRRATPPTSPAAGPAQAATTPRSGGRGR